MSNGYFNYTTFRPDGYWSRRSFVRAWWRLNARDRRWVPPDFPTFVRHVEHGANDPDLRHLRSQPIYMEALPRRSTGGGNDAHVGGLGAVFEEPVAATIVQVDAQPQACTAYLSFLHCANDEETMERLLGKVMEHAAMANCTQFIGPTGPIPQWNSGALQNFFQLTPPMHTPYDPPYVPDLLASMMEPFYTTVLYHVPVPAVLPTAPAPARIVPLALDTLASDLMDLLDEALAHHDVFSKLDESAATVLVRWLGAFPVHGWAAYLDDVPVGFVAVQADLSDLVRKFGGGRLWPQRLLLTWRKQDSRARAGRLLLGVVGSRWRGQGIGRQLWRRVVEYAQVTGWETLICGPVDAQTAAASFLAGQGGVARQRYALYRWTPW